VGWCGLNVLIAPGCIRILPAKDRPLIVALSVWALAMMVLGLWLVWRGNRRLLELAAQAQKDERDSAP
jgi:hypothetical protein